MKKNTRDRAAVAACLLLVGGLGVASLLVGSFPLSLSQILSILSGGMEGSMEAQVFWQLRLPRMCMGLLSGWALGMAGGVYQTVFRKPPWPPPTSPAWPPGPRWAPPVPSCWGRAPGCRS